MKSSKAKWMLCIIVLALIAAVVAPVIAKGPSKPAGKSEIGHVYLHQKDPGTWAVVEDSRWGKMKYNLSGSTFDFVFNAHGYAVEDEGESYQLIYYPDPWPGNGLICLGDPNVVEEEPVLDVNGVPTGEFKYNVHIKGSVNTGDLPKATDENDPNGAKIWLVPTGDVDCDNNLMTGWTPDDILFEADLINFDDTDE